ncbi:hypothetical protein B296_00018827 [Ensete ventricosum]|uniref:Amidohydrolase-related domain-containing protein n=1 Tax=Ensete ventricosum TaxID=4639 RepID=A0A427AGR9_ENSVE|nr:hypothetical protein B296_00018827 [Ensete ventricosum]
MAAMAVRAFSSPRRRLRSDVFLLMVLFLVSVSCSTSEPQGFCAVGYEADCGLSSEKILIKGGTVVNAHRKEVADVYIEDGIVVSVRPNIKVS